MRSAVRFSLLAATLASALAGAFRPVLAQRQPPADSALHTIVRERVDGGRTPALVVGVVTGDGRTRWAAYGTANDATPLDDHTLFELGEVTATFTGTLLAEMISKDLVGVNQPVAELLPAGTAVPRRGRPITVIHLATHSSGLPPLPGGVTARDGTTGRGEYDAAQVLSFLAGYALPRDAGTGFEYSDLNTGLLGYALATRAGKGYEALLVDRVLRPLGLVETAITLAPALRARLARGHDTAGRPVPSRDRVERDPLLGANALRSSLHDMMRYLTMYVTPLGTPLAAAVRFAGRRQFQTAAPDISLGLGWHRHVGPSGDTLVFQGGATAGHAAFIGFDPRGRLGVVVLSGSARRVDDIGLHLLDARLPLTRAAAAGERGSVTGATSGMRARCGPVSARACGASSPASRQRPASR